MADKRAFRYTFSNATTPRGIAFVKEARDVQDARRQATAAQPVGTTLIEIFQCPEHITVR